MQFPQNLNLKPAVVFQVVALSIICILVVGFGVRMIASSMQSLTRSTGSSAPSTGMYYGGGAYDMAVSETESVSLSARNIMPVPQEPSTPGTDGEAYEVTQYSGSIETGNAEKTCGELFALKSRTEVIFEQAQNSDEGCNYTFKVAQAQANEILEILKGMDPKELSQNTHTIKRQIEDFTSATDILRKKLQTIDDTLVTAGRAYDELTALATRAQDVESLTNIINSKLAIIERLTQERINTVAQLEQLDRAKAEQLDRLAYVYFNISVYENKLVDGERLMDSWKSELRAFVYDVNATLQDLTVGLVAVLIAALQYVVYFLIIFFVAKYGWKVAKQMWNK